ncbi:MAG: hypothetical protein VX017_06985, partial [Pseudomonadota bacterium]|nr:hypothetical protein [Pseudomonadota bacterium]
TAKAVSLFSAKGNFRRPDTICHRPEYPGLRQGGSTEIRGRGGAAFAAIWVPGRLRFSYGENISVH